MGCPGSQESFYQDFAMYIGKVDEICENKLIALKPKIDLPKGKIYLKDHNTIILKNGYYMISYNFSAIVNCVGFIKLFATLNHDIIDISKSYTNSFCDNQSINLCNSFILNVPKTSSLQLQLSCDEETSAINSMFNINIVELITKI